MEPRELFNEKGDIYEFQHESINASDSQFFVVKANIINKQLCE